MAWGRHMTLQELTDYYDNHPELQEEIRNDVWEWWEKKKTRDDDQLEQSKDQRDESSVVQFDTLLAG